MCDSRKEEVAEIFTIMSAVVYSCSKRLYVMLHLSLFIHIFKHKTTSKSLKKRIDNRSFVRATNNPLTSQWTDPNCSNSASTNGRSVTALFYSIRIGDGALRNDLLRRDLVHRRRCYYTHSNRRMCNCTRRPAVSNSDSKCRQLGAVREIEFVELVSAIQYRTTHEPRNRVCVVAALTRYWRCSVRLIEIRDLQRENYESLIDFVDRKKLKLNWDRVMSMVSLC